MTFKKAFVQCKKRQGKLPMIKSIQEQSILNQIRKNFQMQTIWLGGTDFRHEGKHVWHDKEGSRVEDGYTNWNSGQPDNWQGKEDCMEMLSNGKWNDQKCSLSIGRQVICEKILL
eukprot:01588.XXX_2719_2197_1 [CDS] Oithona nana genome sequencing.